MVVGLGLFLGVDGDASIMTLASCLISKPHDIYTYTTAMAPSSNDDEKETATLLRR